MKNNNMLCKHPPAVNFLRRYALVILLGLLVLLFSLKTTSFFTGRNLSNVLIVQVTTGCMSIGALLVLIVNEFDLSLGYLLGFCMMLGAWMSKVGFSAGVIIPAMLLASAGAGLVSGIMTVKCKVSSFISTLAVGITLSGFTTGLSGGSVLSRNIPTAIINFGQQRFIGVGYCVWVMLFLLGIMYYVLEHACCTRARVQIGQQKTAGELLNLVQRDNEFYRSIGGMTLSGGEPTMQPEFALALLRLAKAAGIHTAIETCGFCRWEDLEPIASACDLFLYDVKHMDSAAHKKSTGVDNRIIHENLRRLWAIKKQIIIRVPLVPGINDTAENLAATARLAEEVNAREIHILPFHQLGTEKWHALCRAYAMEETPEPTDDAVQVALEIMRAATKRIVSVGGHGM